MLQLADFLRVPLERAGGMMTLPDVYCLFNRARGTELVSPDDLLQVLLCSAEQSVAHASGCGCRVALHTDTRCHIMQAVKHLGKVGAPLELREFADGVRVLQSLSHSNEEV